MRDSESERVRREYVSTIEIERVRREYVSTIDGERG